MATFHLVQPELVKRANDLLARVKREQAAREAVQNWVTDINEAKAVKAGTMPGAAEQSALGWPLNLIEAGHNPPHTPSRPDR